MRSSKVARLIPCTDLEYAAFASLQVVEYARQLAGAGEVAPEQSYELATQFPTDAHFRKRLPSR